MNFERLTCKDPNFLATLCLDRSRRRTVPQASAAAGDIPRRSNTFVRRFRAGNTSPQHLPHRFHGFGRGFKS